MTETDPRAKWRTLPERTHLEETTVELDAGGPDSTNNADDNLQPREAQWLLERGGGLGI